MRRVPLGPSTWLPFLSPHGAPQRLAGQTMSTRRTYTVRNRSSEPGRHDAFTHSCSRPDRDPVRYLRVTLVPALPTVSLSGPEWPITLSPISPTQVEFGASLLIDPSI